MVSATLLPTTPESGAVGVNHNVGQCTDSDGKGYEMPDTGRTDAKLKQYQRKMDRQQKGSHRRRQTGHKLSKLHHQRTRTHSTATHGTSHRLTDKTQTVVLEDLDVKNMPRRATDSVEEPGTNVKAKSGLNRVILASA